MFPTQKLTIDGSPDRLILPPRSNWLHQQHQIPWAAAANGMGQEPHDNKRWGKVLTFPKEPQSPFLHQDICTRWPRVIRKGGFYQPWDSIPPPKTMCIWDLQRRSPTRSKLATEAKATFPHLAVSEGPAWGSSSVPSGDWWYQINEADQYSTAKALKFNCHWNPSTQSRPGPAHNLNRMMPAKM